MIYKLYLMTDRGYKFVDALDYESIMNVLDELVIENPQRRIIVVEQDEETQTDNVFYVHTGRVEDYLDWKECMNQCRKIKTR